MLLVAPSVFFRSCILDCLQTSKAHKLPFFVWIFFNLLYMKKILLLVAKNILLQITTLLLIVWCIAIAAWTNIATKSDGQTINSTIWNELVNNINTIWAKVDTLSNLPTWAVIAFNLSSCPTWWILADGNNSTPDLRGEFIRWLDNGRWIDWSRILWSFQTSQNLVHNHIWITDLAWNHSHRVQWTWRMKYTWWSSDVIAWLNPWMWMDNNRWTDPVWDHQHSFTTQNSWWSESRPRNVALLYCVKQ